MGPHTMQFIDHMIKSRAFPEQAYRACLDVLRLSTAYGADRLEKVCQIAYEAGATRYHQIELILKNKIDSVPHSDAMHSAVIAPHKNIRDPHYYK